MKLQRILTMSLAVMLLLGSVFTSVEAASPTQISQATERTLHYLEQRYKAKGTAAVDDWSLIGLVMAQQQIPSPKWGERKIWQAEWKKRMDALDPRKTTDYARFVLTLLAAGEDPSQFGGRNLIAQLQKAQLTNGKFADQITGQGQELINAHVWSVIALHAAGEDIPRLKLAKSWLVSKQLPDGGFQYAVGARTGGVDMTAMALLAFRAMGMSKEEPSVKKALDFLRRAQDDQGGFKEGGIRNAESVANVICALVAWGEPMVKWGKGAVTPADQLLTFQHSTGGFVHSKNGLANQLATAQALLALGDLQRGSSYLAILREKSMQRKAHALPAKPFSSASRGFLP